MASSKLLPVLVEMVGIELRFFMLVRWGASGNELPPAIMEKPGPPKVRRMAPVPYHLLTEHATELFRRAFEELEMVCCFRCCNHISKGVHI